MNAPKSVEALSGPVSGMDTSSVAGVPCSQAGSHTGGLTPLEKELVEALKDIRSWAIDERAALREQEIRAISALIAKAEATATEAQHAGQWRPMSELPAKNRRITALYNDGSGSRIYFHTEDGQLFDGEDGCEYAWADRDQHTHWTYLPDGYRLWVEDGDEPMTFPGEMRRALAITAEAEREGSRAGDRS